MGVSANFLTNMKSSLTSGKYQTTLKPPPKKITLHCQEIDKFHNEIDSQPSTQLFSLDTANYAVYTIHHLCLIYLPLSSSSLLYSLHFTLLDENHRNVTPKTFNLVLLYNKSMSVYDNNKVYPTLPSAPEDDTAQKY